MKEQNVVDCSVQYGNNYGKGGTMNNVFKYIQAQGGIELDENYPYEAAVFKLFSLLIALSSTVFPNHTHIVFKLNFEVKTSQLLLKIFVRLRFRNKLGKRAIY